MNHWFDLLNIAGSVVLAAFGLYVWRVEPGERRNRAFALYAVGFSLATGLDNIEGLLRPEGTLLFGVAAVRDVLYGLGGIGAAWFGIAAAEPKRRSVLLWGLIPAVLAVGSILRITTEPSFTAVHRGPLVSRVLAAAMPIGGLLGGSAFAVLVFADSFRRPDRSIEQRREMAFLASALLLYPCLVLAFLGTRFGVLAVDPNPGSTLGLALAAMALIGTLLLVVAAWIRNTRLPEGSGAARNVTLLAAGMGMIGLGLAATGASSERLLGIPFLARVGSVALLGYAILRHQILDIEAKVEWGVSKTTIAGIFIAVFFVVSEGAQALFADFAGDELLGVLAAGLLVFAISPLQRMADKFAARAVPGGAEAGADAEERYRRAVRMALADGEISAAEEDELAASAEELGLGPKRALEIRREVESDA